MISSGTVREVGGRGPARLAWTTPHSRLRDNSQPEPLLHGAESNPARLLTACAFARNLARPICYPDCHACCLPHRRLPPKAPASAG